LGEVFGQSRRVGLTGPANAARARRGGDTVSDSW